MAPVALGARLNLTEDSLPPDVAVGRLIAGTPLGRARFLPAGADETFAAIFATWNTLDAVMWARTRLVQNETDESGRTASKVYVGGRHAHLPRACFVAVCVRPTLVDAHTRTTHTQWQTGYLREVQVRRMVRLVQAARAADPERVLQYCEVGMNGGHSVSAMLLADSRLRAHVFDTVSLKYSYPVAELLETQFGGRFELHAGYSQDTLPGWIEAFRTNGSTLPNLLCATSTLIYTRACACALWTRRWAPRRCSCPPGVLTGAPLTVARSKQQLRRHSGGRRPHVLGRAWRLEPPPRRRTAANVRRMQSPRAREATRSTLK
eukprot:3397286-Prymnesium_polylepis.2